MQARMRWLLLNLVVIPLIISKTAGHGLCTNGNLRLNDGVLEICKSDEWWRVCSSEWGNLDTAVACKQLGYDGGYTISIRHDHSSSAEDPVEYHCTGRENNLQHCNRVTISSCSNYQINIKCVQRNISDSCKSGDIRLWGGARESLDEGNIELCNGRGVWSAVADHSWGYIDAVVACRQLGYTHSLARHFSRSKYGQRLQPVEYGGLICRGDESTLQSCGISSSFVETQSDLYLTTSNYYAGVKCINRTTVMISDTVDGGLQCTNGILRHNDGILEICKSDEWWRVCSSEWGNLDTAVACKQLGYDGGYFVNTNGQSSSTVDPVKYHCTGRENNLQHCNHVTISSCSSGIIVTCVRRNISDPCKSGDIRLWGGESPNEGNVELCNDRRVWGAVADYYWEYPEAVVACKQLGYMNAIVQHFRGSKYGRTLHPVEHGGLSCRGNESTLQSCGVRSYFVERRSSYPYTNQNTYAGVRCIAKATIDGTCTNGTVRLADGYSRNSGFAEVCIDGIWIGICKSSYEAVGSYICNQLGYQRYTSIDGFFFVSNRTLPPAYVYSEYNCLNTLQGKSLLECIQGSSYYGFQYTHSCTEYGILCCPNDTTLCTLGPKSPVESPQVNPTTLPIVNTNTMVPSTNDVRVVEISLCFRTTATSLILANSADLRGLEKDIYDKIDGCTPENSDCSTLTKTRDGFLILRERIQFKFNLDNSQCMDTLKKCFEDNPKLQYLNTDLYLDLTLC